MISNAVHAYMATTGTTLGELERIAADLREAYVRERRNVEKTGRYNLQAKTAADQKLWLETAVHVHRSGLSAGRWMAALFIARPPYPHLNNLPKDDNTAAVKDVEAKVAGVAGSVLAIQLNDFRARLATLGKSPAELIDAMPDRYDALFAFCILSRLGDPAAAGYRPGARLVLRGNPGLQRLYRTYFQEEMDRLCQ